METMTMPARGAPYTAKDLGPLGAGRKYELIDGCLIVSEGEPFTAEDLAAMPDDGRRREIVNGALLVTPAPSKLHQRVSMALVLLLSRSLPPDLEAFHAPLDVPMPDGTVLQPDLLVVRRADPGITVLAEIPMLAIEIASPNTRNLDRSLKFLLLEEAGCPSYWIVDPDEPRLTAWNLVDGAYELVADIAGDESWTSTLPYAVTVTPGELVR